MNTGISFSNGRQLTSLADLFSPVQSRKYLTSSQIIKRTQKSYYRRTSEVPVPQKTEETKNIENSSSNGKSNFDARAVKFDLKLDFSAENLGKTIDNLIGRNESLPKSAKKPGESDGNQEKAGNQASFLSVGLSVDAERIRKKPVREGNGTAREVHVRRSRRTDRRELSDYRIDRIKLQIQRRQTQEINREKRVYFQNGYRIVHKRISQRYQEDVSLKAELLNKFENVAQKVEEKSPESTDKFLKTTDKLVQDKRVSGEAVSGFFDVVESYMDKTEKTLHRKIDRFINRIAKGFNIDEEQLNEMRTNLHEKVDTFFDNVDRTLNQMEKDRIDSLAGKSYTEPVLPGEDTTVSETA